VRVVAQGTGWVGRRWAGVRRGGWGGRGIIPPRCTLYNIIRHLGLTSLLILSSICYFSYVDVPTSYSNSDFVVMWGNHVAGVAWVDCSVPASLPQRLYWARVIRCVNVKTVQLQRLQFAGCLDQSSAGRAKKQRLGKPSVSRPQLISGSFVKPTEIDSDRWRPQ
jgi:hypothetical protein